MTKNRVGKSRGVMANFAFSALLFSLFGWVSLEAALLSAGTGLGLHLLVCALGLTLTVISFRRCRVWWPSFAYASAPEKRVADNRFGVAEVGGCIALIMAGGILALGTSGGSMTLVSICAGILSFTPWSRLSFCNRHFYLDYALVATGAVPILFIFPNSPGFIFYSLSTWVLWSIAMAELVAIFGQERQSETRQTATAETAFQIAERKVAPQLNKLVERP